MCAPNGVHTQMHNPDGTAQLTYTAPAGVNEVTRTILPDIANSHDSWTNWRTSRSNIFDSYRNVIIIIDAYSNLFYRPTSTGSRSNSSI